jgi:hypothetical protein
MSNLIEREYVDLQSHRVALRRKRDRLVYERSCAPQLRYGLDGYDHSIAMVEAALRGTERRWTELCMLLHRPSSRPPIKLAPAVRITTPVRTQPARGQPVQLRQPGPYLTRMMGSR